MSRETEKWQSEERSVGQELKRDLMTIPGYQSSQMECQGRRHMDNKQGKTKRTKGYWVLKPNDVRITLHNLQVAGILHLLFIFIYFIYTVTVHCRVNLANDYSALPLAFPVFVSCVCNCLEEICRYVKVATQVEESALPSYWRYSQTFERPAILKSAIALRDRQGGFNS